MADTPKFTVHHREGHIPTKYRSRAAKLKPKRGVPREAVTLSAEAAKAAWSLLRAELSRQRQGRQRRGRRTPWMT